LARGKEPYFSHWCSKEFGMSDCPRANNGADNVRKLQRALYRASKQDKERRFYSLYDITSCEFSGGQTLLLAIVEAKSSS
jgi:hypothetical protein